LPIASTSPSRSASFTTSKTRSTLCSVLRAPSNRVAKFALFSRLPISLVHHPSLCPATVLWLAMRLGLRPSEYLKLLARFNFAHLRSIEFDQMLPRIAHY
jgi:hypothetical protein